MKAWSVRNITDDDLGQEIIWADNVKEAKKKACQTDMMMEVFSYIDLRVHRAPEFDGMEGLSRKDFRKQQWINGWQFYDGTELPYFDDLKSYEVDKTWDDWYQENFGRSSK